MSPNDKRAATLTPRERQAFRADALQIEMYYVRCGEAILISHGPNAILVDGGSDTRSDRNVTLGSRFARRIPQHSLKAIVASHPHRDHTNFHHALVTTCQDRLDPRGALYFDNATEPADSNWQRLETWQPNLPLRRVPVSERAGLDSSDRIPGFARDAEAHLLRGSTSARSIEGQKYWSVFLFLRFRRAWMLFTGDAYKGYERGVLPRLEALSPQAHLLKVTHHGSSDGTSEELVSSLRPKVAIVSTDAPADHRLEADVRQTLMDAKSEIYATYEPGRPPRKRDIVVRTDGRMWEQDGCTGILFEVRTRPPALF